jgi:hypothetical protein
MPLYAWVDESMHEPMGALPTPTYLLAATIAQPANCDLVRDDLRALLIGKSKRLHWRDESNARQQVIASVIARHDLIHTVVVGVPLDRRRQERGRRQCMERLLQELTELDVENVWLESRTETLNGKDIQLVAAVRSKRLLPSSLRVDFALPSEEPMLWLPDAVAGALGAHKKATNSAPHQLLSGMIREIELRLR